MKWYQVSYIENKEYKLKCLVMSGYEYIKQKMEEG